MMDGSCAPVPSNLPTSPKQFPRNLHTFQSCSFDHQIPHIFKSSKEGNWVTLCCLLLLPLFAGSWGLLGSCPEHIISQSSCDSPFDSWLVKIVIWPKDQQRRDSWVLWNEGMPHPISHDEIPTLQRDGIQSWGLWERSGGAEGGASWVDSKSLWAKRRESLHTLSSPWDEEARTGQFPAHQEASSHQSLGLLASWVPTSRNVRNQHVWFKSPT